MPVSSRDTPIINEPTGAPNVVMIVLDDLGFAQLGCYGAEIATPNIDRLADNGLRYNSFHVTSLCGPTRASLVTGRNHHAVGMGIGPEVPMEFAGYTGRIPKSAGTLPRLLRDAGYSTLAVGKWHLTPRFERNQAGPFEHWPLGLGFERYYGFLGALTDQWTPHLVCDNRFVEPPLTPEEGYHLTEDLASQAIRLMQDQQQAAPDKPFFLYFATAAPHSPHQVPDAWIEPYRGKFEDGWEALRSRTFLRQKELGVVPPGTIDTGRPSWVAPWEDLPTKERQLYARMMEVYAGFVTHTDAQIGRIMEFLDAMGVTDNTLVMFLSDNGASADAGPHGMVRRYGHRPGRDDIDSMASHIDDLGGIGVASDYAWGWAWAGNTPFRLWKRYTWLGGVRTPLIVRWPAGIPAEHNGDVRQQFCHAVDLMPTALEVAGADRPAVLDGVGQQPLHGESLLPTFREADARIERAPQYFEMLGSRAIYHEGWKATTDHVGSMLEAERNLMEGSDDFESDRWSLYNLEEDFSEAIDVAGEYPERFESPRRALVGRSRPESRPTAHGWLLGLEPCRGHRAAPARRPAPVRLSARRRAHPHFRSSVQLPPRRRHRNTRRPERRRNHMHPTAGHDGPLHRPRVGPLLPERPPGRDLQPARHTRTARDRRTDSSRHTPTRTPVHRGLGCEGPHHQPDAERSRGRRHGPFGQPSYHPVPTRSVARRSGLRHTRVRRLPTALSLHGTHPPRRLRRPQPTRAPRSTPTDHQHP